VLSVAGDVQVHGDALRLEREGKQPTIALVVLDVIQTRLIHRSRAAA
jgi:hypothetical protein